MTAVLLEASEERWCSFKNCPKGNKIMSGERMVKDTIMRSDCCSTEKDSGYFHEECWKNKKGRKS